MRNKYFLPMLWYYCLGLFSKKYEHIAFNYEMMWKEL